MTDKQDCSTCTTPHRVENGLSRHPQFYCNGLELPFDTLWVMSKRGCASHSDFNPQLEHEKVLAEYNDFLLTKLVQELAGTWRMRDEKLFSIIRKYRRVPIGAMKADLRQSKDGEP